MNRIALGLFLFLFGHLPNITAQPMANRSPLTIDQIMEGEKFIGYSPDGVFWGDDSRTIYFNWNPERDTLSRLFHVGIDGNQPEPVLYEAQRFLSMGAGNYDRNRTRKVYAKGGDLFLLDLSSQQLTRLTQTIDRESNPTFSGDDRYIIFQREDNLFAWELAGGVVRQLTNFRRGSERKEPPPAAYRQWLQDQQMELFDVLRDRKTAEKLRSVRSDSLELKMPRQIYYGEKRLVNLQASPDLNFVTCLVVTPGNAPNTEVPYWVTESGYVDPRNMRSKVGSPQDTYQMGIYDVQRDTFYFVDTKQIPGIYDKPAFLREYHSDTSEYKERYDKPREVTILGPVFADDGKAAVVVRSHDNKDRWLMLLDPATGKLSLLDRQHDDAWIGGPGIVGWNFALGTFGWLPDNKRLYFQSEKTGYSHLYTLDVTTGEARALTSGRWEVREAQLSNDKQFFYLTTNQESPHEQHFYRLSVDGGDLERLTTKTGNCQVTLSPDERYLAVRYSYSNQPWELFIMENRPGAEMRQITRSTTEAFRTYPWRDPQIVYFTAADGAKVPARLYRPSRPRKGGPAVIFVHGAGYLQNVHRWWSSYSREFMFNNLLADNGYTVLDIDYRGSDGYGRDWRTGIYRHMGGKDLSDHVDGVRFLVQEYGVDPARIGIYGGSYGGFITLMALFTAPDSFRSGAALRAVTDWAHYNHGYTANILNTPVEDPKAYQRSSPIYFADRLQGNLLMLHGMVDTNVQFQDIVRLSQRLIELGKDKWELAVFPVEDHGFVEPSSWTDEYKRIYRLFETTLK